SRGSILYLKDEDVHFFDQLDNLCLTNVLFMPDEFHSSPDLISLLTESCRSDSGQIMVGQNIQQQAELLLMQIREENERQDTYSSLMVETLFSQLAVLLWRDRELNTKFRSEEQDNLLTLINPNIKFEVQHS
ncbi:MAG: AraC family transcriptional regulator, partial [Tolumonas sp.]